VKRQQTGTTARVYAYGCGQPVAGWREAEAENERAGALWDQLVGIERMYERSIEAAARSDVPELGQILGRIDEAHTQINGDRERRKALIAEIRALRRQCKPIIWQWMRQHKDAMREIEQGRREAVIQARRSTDAWWANYNAVIQRYEIARRETARRGRRLRHNAPERDDGCLTVQIQRTRSGLGAAPGELSDGTVAALQIGMVPPEAHDPYTGRGLRRRLCQATVEMRVDLAGNRIRLPIWMHRPLPEDGRVKSAQLVWRRHGDRLVYQLCLTVSQQKKAIQHPRSGAGISIQIEPHMHGRVLRIATILAEPRQYIDLDPQWVHEMDRVDRLPAVMADESVADQQRIRARLQRPGLWSRLLRRRREQYRLAARALAQRYGSIRIEMQALSEQAWLERGQDSNAARHRACAHQLVAEIQHQAAKTGTTVEIALADASAPVPQRVRRRRDTGRGGARPAALAPAPPRP